MTKSEWSGWAQAIGAVIAILGAVGIAWWQARSNLLHQQWLMVSLSRTAAGSLAAVIEDVLSRGGRPIVVLEARRRAAEQVVSDFRAIRIETLALRWTEAVVALRAIAIQVEGAIRSAEVPDGGKNGKWELVSTERYDFMVETITDLEKKAAPYIATIAQAHPGVSVPRWFQSSR